jgi:hypothetical protein
LAENDDSTKLWWGLHITLKALANSGLVFLTLKALANSSPGFALKPWGHNVSLFFFRNPFQGCDQLYGGIHTQGFKANPGLELANAFSVLERRNFGLELTSALSVKLSLH